jgi:hypothetical protein
MRRKRNKLGKWVSLSFSDYLLVLEALFYLFVSNVLIFLVPFRLWNQWIGDKNGSTTTGVYKSDHTDKRRMVLKGVRRAVKLFGNKPKCFAISLTLKKMLERRGVPVILYLGVNRDNTRNLMAHAWVTSGEKVIYGGKHAASRFKELVVFA